MWNHRDFRQLAEDHTAQKWKNRESGNLSNITQLTYRSTEKIGYLPKVTQLSSGSTKDQASCLRSPSSEVEAQRS